MATPHKSGRKATAVPEEPVRLPDRVEEPEAEEQEEAKPSQKAQPKKKKKIVVKKQAQLQQKKVHKPVKEPFTLFPEVIEHPISRVAREMRKEMQDRVNEAAEKLGTQDPFLLAGTRRKAKQRTSHRERKGQEEGAQGGQ